MFREMRRKNQKLSPEECNMVLNRGTSGVLAVSGEDHYPYAVPLSYVYDRSRLLFHCAKTGHKLDAIAENDRVSFCVVDQDRVMPEKYTSYYRSVIVFGRARVLEESEKWAALELLAAKYSPDLEQGRLREIDRLFEQVCMVAVEIERITGKEAIELVRERQRPTTPEHAYFHQRQIE